MCLSIERPKCVCFNVCGRADMCVSCMYCTQMLVCVFVGQVLNVRVCVCSLSVWVRSSVCGYLAYHGERERERENLMAETDGQ